MQCTKHPFDRAADVCAHCGLAFCRPCLVYPTGEHRAPFCVSCAVVRSGVRRRGPVGKPISSRQWKRRRRELQRMLADAPEQTLNLARLIDLPFVDEAEILQSVAPRSERTIDWCA